MAICMRNSLRGILYEMDGKTVEMMQMLIDCKEIARFGREIHLYL